MTNHLLKPQKINKTDKYFFFFFFLNNDDEN